MKTTCSITLAIALLLGAAAVEAATPDGADAYLVSPWDFEGHNIRLNVVSVRPANFESPLPGIIFYHANTETLDHRPGGEMLICVPKSESEHFSRFYGMDPHNRNIRILSGTFRLAHHHHPHKDHPGDQNDNDAAPIVSGTNAGDHADHHEGGVWFVDYKGQDKDILDKNPDLELPAGGGPGDHHDGPDGGNGNGGPGPGSRNGNGRPGH
ncbi:MAG: hypothetical protein WCD79_03495 [Chthoniobacteraceae bacterium]